MHQNLSVSLDRADELLRELKAEYQRALTAKQVTPRAEQLTHEVCERLRSVLDRVCRRYWDLRIASYLTEEDREKAHVYFPVSEDAQGFNSTLGRWRWKSVKIDHDDFYQWLLHQQPFHHERNTWLRVLNELAVQGKHVDLVPQKRIENTRITVQGRGASVSWDAQSVRFGSGVYIGGVPVDPQTQRIVPTPGMTERVETWVTFFIPSHGVDALAFCQDAAKQTRKLIETFSARFEI